MKIGILQDDFPPESAGGAAVIAYNSAVGLAGRGHDVFIICATKGERPAYEEKDGLRIYSVKSEDFGFFQYYFCLYNPAAIPAIRAILKKERPDVVHCHNLNAALSYYSLKIAKKFSKKVFITAHDVMLFNYGKLASERYLKNFNCAVSWRDHLRAAGKRYNPLRNVLIKRYLKYADKIFAVSRALQSALNANGIKNTEVLYNCLDLGSFYASQEEISTFKAKYSLMDKKIIFFAARISAPKGIEQIIKAMPIILEKIPNTVLVASGTGAASYMKRLGEMAESAHLAGKVLFTGNVPYEKIKPIYFASDVVVTPSLCLDTFNLTNIEAMAAKKPVIGTCYGGTPEVVVNGETGYIANPLNMDEMAEKIIAVLSDERLAEKLGSAGYERVKENFSLDKQVDETLKYYGNIKN